MTGPEHYRQAEIQLEFAATASETESAQWHQGQAQVHATLALAAATALNDSDGGLSIPEHTAWTRAAGTIEPRD